MVSLSFSGSTLFSFTLSRKLVTSLLLNHILSRLSRTPTHVLVSYVAFPVVQVSRQRSTFPFDEHDVTADVLQKQATTAEGQV